MCCQGVSPHTAREQSTHSAVIWSRKGFQHFSDISRFLNFMARSPQSCLSSACRRAGTPASHMHWFMSMLQAHVKWLRVHSCEELRRQISLATWQVVHRAKCTHTVHAFSHRIKVQVLKFAGSLLWHVFKPEEKNPHFPPLDYIYTFTIYFQINARGAKFLRVCCVSQWQTSCYKAACCAPSRRRALN